MKQPRDGLGHSGLRAYAQFLAHLAAQGRSHARVGRRLPPRPEFVDKMPGLIQLLSSMTSVAPAFPDASDEEWNPLSQRPHAPLTPSVTIDELGHDILALKEAIDAFTTLAHEVMHIALWEPFFVGAWHPGTSDTFIKFSLKAEAFCFFYSDIIISRAIRVRFPDGELALTRQTPSNTLFHPVRAFDAAGISDTEQILKIYLDSFSGKRSQLAKTSATDPYAGRLKKQISEFYSGSLPLLDQLYTALNAFGLWDAYYKKFCAIPNLPTIFVDLGETPKKSDLNRYFIKVWQDAFSQLQHLDNQLLEQVRCRRMVQTRAYFAMQVRWLIEHELLVGRGISKPLRRTCLQSLDSYLDDLAKLLVATKQKIDQGFRKKLARLDHQYEAVVRSELIAANLWVGQRWMIAPQRAGGQIQVSKARPLNTTKMRHESHPTQELTRQRQIALFEIMTYAITELTANMQKTKTIANRSLYLSQIGRLSRLGAICQSYEYADLDMIERQLRRELSRTPLLALWSLPLASFDPVNNHYRELIFSYQ